MGVRYSRHELLVLIGIEAEYGPITYQKPVLLEQLFQERTGRYRASACLYFAMWRIKRGYYDRLLSQAEYSRAGVPILQEQPSDTLSLF